MVRGQLAGYPAFTSNGHLVIGSGIDQQKSVARDQLAVMMPSVFPS
jgi:hypothetical protein